MGYKASYVYSMGASDNHPPLIEMTVHVEKDEHAGIEESYECTGWLTEERAVLSLGSDSAHMPTLSVKYHCPTGQVKAHLKPIKATFNEIQLTFARNGGDYYRKESDGTYVEWSREDLEAQFPADGTMKMYLSVSWAKSMNWVDEMPVGASIMDSFIEIKHWPFKDVPRDTFYFLDLNSMSMVDLADVTLDNHKDYYQARRE